MDDDRDNLGFDYTVRKNGDVVIFHHGCQASTLRGRAAETFLLEAETATDRRALQRTMARLTGNHKRGNERAASRHPRNRRS